MAVELKLRKLEDGERAAGIYDYLRQRILDGDIPPETTISQVQLAQQLGISRTPLREALRRLQQEGLIQAEPNRRARVVGLDPADLEIVYASRLFYEPLGLLMTVPLLSEDDVGALTRELAGMRRASDESDYPAWELAHGRFHGLLALHAAEPLKIQIAAYAARGNRYRRLYQSAISRNWNVGDPEHEAILVACRDGDKDRAASELARHLGGIALSLLGRVRPEYEPTVLRNALRMVTGPESRATAR